MFGKTFAKYFSVIAMSSAVSIGVTSCKDIPESNSDMNAIIAIDAMTEKASPSLQSIAENISPPDVLLEGGKEHFNKRLPEIAAQPILNGGMLMAGDSITEAWLWHKDSLPLPSSNHGVGWDIAEGLKDRLSLILRHNPDHIFVMIGTNDIGYGHKAEEVAGHVETFITTLQREKPEAVLYLQAVLPREAASMPKVRSYNAAYEELASKTNIEFIDMTSKFAAPDGTLNVHYTEDGLHLNAKAYELWGHLLKESLSSD